MSCQDMQNLIHAYVDRELDVQHTLEMEQHLKACEACAQAHRNLSELQTALQAPDLRYAAPQTLRRRLTAAQPGATFSLARQRWMVSAAMAAVLVLGIGFGPAWWTSRVDEEAVSGVLSAHMRSLMGEHLQDVVSTDQHTVKPWFNGKLDFSPPVTDFAARGFPLAGGRLDYLDKRPVAALVYRHRLHIINVFVWPTAAAVPVHSYTEQGYHLVHWQTNGFNWWAVSDLNQEELLQFVQMLQPGG